VITDYRIIPQAGGCRCWETIYALGHDGHCCFVRDDRNRKINDGWREVEVICHAPNDQPVVLEVAPETPNGVTA
jgi:hypothetical protein